MALQGGESKVNQGGAGIFSSTPVGQNRESVRSGSEVEQLGAAAFGSALLYSRGAERCNSATSSWPGDPQ
jgi:hypothetical protein